MKLLAICRGTAERMAGKSYRTGIDKHPVDATVLIDRHGLLGDAVCNTKYHGGPDQALLIEGSRTLDWWAEHLGRAFVPGSFGENLVVEGLDNRDLAVGDRLHIGGVVVEATAARIPCNTLAGRMGDPAFAKRYYRAARPGIYCRVLVEGAVSPGDDVQLEKYEGERISIPEMLSVYGRALPETERVRYLAAPIASRVRAMLEG